MKEYIGDYFTKESLKVLENSQKKEIDTYKKTCMTIKVEHLQSVIERYEKALIEIKNISSKDDYYTGWHYNIAEKALEGGQ